MSRHKRPPCKAPSCRNLAAVNKSGRTCKRGFCHSCSSRNWRKLNPFQDAYNNLRNHARAAGNPFNLSFEDFKKVATLWGYIDGKGTTRDALHIDRKDPRKGYEIGNIQPLTNSQNARKAVLDRRAFIRDAFGHAWQADPKKVIAEATGKQIP